MARRARDVIRQVIEGKPDEDVMQLVANMGGVDAVLEMVFEGMEDALVPDRAEDGVIGWRIDDGSVHDVTLSVKDHKASYEMRAADGARVTLELSFTDFIRLICGELDGGAAVSDGRLRVDGDVTFAEHIPKMFGVA